MKVIDLIARLSTLPQDAEVSIQPDSSGDEIRRVHSHVGFSSEDGVVLSKDFDETSIRPTSSQVQKHAVEPSKRNHIMNDAVLLRTVAKSAVNLSDDARAQLLAIAKDL